jgi:hypothetical protein
MSASTKPTTLRATSSQGLGMQPPLMPTGDESVGGGLGRIR